jgi:hypothetical protein
MIIFGTKQADKVFYSTLYRLFPTTTPKPTVKFRSVTPAQTIDLKRQGFHSGNGRAGVG